MFVGCDSPSPLVHLANGPTLVSAFADVTIGRGATVTRMMRMIMMLMMMWLMTMMEMMMMPMMMITFSVQCLLTSRGGGRAEVAVDKVEMCQNKQTNEGSRQTYNIMKDHDRHTEVEVNNVEN